MSSIIKVDTVQDQDGNNIINENANVITVGASGDTITIPSGATLANNGTATGFFEGIAWQSSIVTASTLTAVAGNGYWINTTSNACTITLPASASVGDQIIFTDYLRTWGTNAVTINQNSLNFQGYTSPNPIYNTDGQSVNIIYSGATQGWIPTVDDDVTNKTPQIEGTAYYLVVAGGGGGGSTWSPNTIAGAGGGAGGYLTNYGGSAYTLSNGNTYTITVGTGGAGATLTGTTGTGGNNSSFTGADITDVIATGGGGGGSSTAANGQDGGSGGGGCITKTSGSGNTPSTTPSQGFAGGTGLGGPNYGSGGGGGASEVGNNGTTTVGGDGGDGNSNSITGSAVIYAGGGGGATYNGGTVGSGGTGGGGNAGSASSPGAVGGNGTDGLGGGGGGATYNGTNFVGGDGGNGVVIVRLSTSDYNIITVTGTHTTAVSGSDTIITWTASPATLVT